VAHNFRDSSGLQKRDGAYFPERFIFISKVIIRIKFIISKETLKKKRMREKIVYLPFKTGKLVFIDFYFENKEPHMALITWVSTTATIKKKKNTDFCFQTGVLVEMLYIHKQ
jgi:hypothetical protein